MTLLYVWLRLFVESGVSLGNAGIMLMSPASFALAFSAFSFSAQGLRAAGNSQGAESIGDAVKNINRQYASHFSHGGPAEASAFGQSIAADLQSEDSVLVNPEVSRPNHASGPLE